LQWLPLKKHRPSEAVCITHLFWSQLSTLEPNSSEVIRRSPQPPFIERGLVVLALRVAFHVENFDADIIVRAKRKMFVRASASMMIQNRWDGEPAILSEGSRESTLKLGK
jgi:hypothetical protein